MRHLLPIVTIVGVVSLAPSGLALAQQPTQACSAFPVGSATYLRCQTQKTRDFLLPGSNGKTDPASVGKPYGSWSGSFGGERWQPTPGK